MSIYVTPGPSAAIQAAIAAASVPVGEQHRVGGSKSRNFHDICGALTQLPQQHADERADRIAPGTVDSVRARIARIRAAMAAELDAADRYIASVYDALGLEEED